MAGESTDAAAVDGRGATGVRISVFGPVAVVGADGEVSGRALGGRRARLALVALALTAAPLTADRLAAIIWTDQQPPTWPAALRGVIRSLRTALVSAGAGGERVVITTPSGYGLAAEAEVDLHQTASVLRAAAALADQGRHEAAMATAEPLTLFSGDQLLPGEDASWLDSYRAQADAAALLALELVARSASTLGDHHRAAEAGRRAVEANPLDERAHRILIGALHRSGDRAGVVLAYEACRQALADQLGIDPAPETVELYLSAIGAGSGSGAARLPQPTSAFFGRERELADLAAALAAPGLVTVAGPGGVGKSRLVLQVAAAAEYAGGKSWVSLAPVSADELVASTVSASLRLPVGTDDPATLVAAHFAPVGRALLILDGCEAVIDGTASLVSGLLSLCPTLSVVVTSRMPLSVEAETVIAVEPLRFGVSAAFEIVDLAASPQVRLLADRARAGGGNLVIDSATAPIITELCRRCGGLPLALELAAAQLAVMSVPDLLDHLPSLVAGGQDWLRGVAMSSYELLDADEAAVFRRFGVLAGSVALPLVRDVVADAAIPPVRIVRILRELTARGLLAVDRSGPRWRYQQDDDLHRLAAELLEVAGESGATLARLAAAVLAIVPADPGAAPVPYLEPVGEVLPQVRSLLAAAIDSRIDLAAGLELGFKLHRYWAATNVAEGRFWLSRLLAAVGADRTGSAAQAHAAYALGYLSYWSGDTGAAVRELRLAVDLLAGQSDVYAARALIYLGGLADDMDQGDEALAYVRSSIEAAQPFGVDLQVGANIGMGCVLAERADAAAAGYAVEAIELCRRAGSPEQLAATLPTAAMVCWQVGDQAQARSYVAEATPLLADSRRIARVVLLTVAAGLELADNDLAAAMEIASIANTEATDLGIERELPLIRCILARALLASGAVDGAAAAAVDAVQAARALTFTFPLALCLETAALVYLARAGDPEVGRTLLAAAAGIRARGHRPGPVTLSAAVRQAEAELAEREAFTDRAWASPVRLSGTGDASISVARAADLAVAALRPDHGRAPQEATRPRR
jgi:predicted ATPase/DNA-binding SARP family transcriptional activator